MVVRFTNAAALGMFSALLVLGLLLRLECARDELWIDEYFTAWTVSDSWNAALQRSSISHQAPWYTAVIYGVTKLAGVSAASLRGPSVLSGMLVVVLGAWLAWRLTKLVSAALVATALAAIDPHFIFYATEARPYAIVQLLGLCGAICVWRWFAMALQQGSSHSTGYWPLGGWAAAAITAFYLHFTSIIAMASQLFVSGLATLRLRIGRTPWLVAGVVCAIASIPGMVALWGIHDRASDWLGFSSLPTLFESLRFSLLFYTAPSVIGLLASALDSRVRARADWRGVGLLLGTSLTAIAGIVAITGFGIAPLGHYRYAIAATGVMPALGACSVAVFSRGWARALAAAIFVALAWSQTSIHLNPFGGMLQPPLRWERWSAVVDRINRDSSDRVLPVIVFPNLIEDHRMTSADPRRYGSYFWAPMVAVNHLDGRCPIFARALWAADRFDDELLAEIQHSGGTWLVVRGGGGASAESRSALDRILDELQSKLSVDGETIDVERCGPTSSDVQLVRVLLR